MRRKERQSTEGRQSGQKVGESRQTLLSPQEASLMRCKQIICVEEKKHSKPGGIGEGAIKI